MFEKFSDIVIIPIICLFIITVVKAFFKTQKFGNEDIVDIAMDLAMVGTGACGSVFANDVLAQKWQHLTVFAVAVVLISVACTVWLAWLKKFDNVPPVSGLRVRRNMIYGALPICMVTAILAFGYIINP
jgi:hypothetical protein